MIYLAHRDCVVSHIVWPRLCQLSSALHTLAAEVTWQLLFLLQLRTTMASEHA